MSGSADCHTVVTQKMWPSTGNEPAASHYELPVCFRNPKGWNNALTFRSKKRAIGWSVKELLGHTALRPTEWKYEFATKVWYPNSHSVYISTEARICKKDLGTPDLCYRENMMDQMFGRWFCFPCECGGLPYTHTIRVDWYWKMSSKQAFQAVSDTQHSKHRKSYVPSRKVRHKWKVCFQASNYQELSRF